MTPHTNQTRDVLANAGFPAYPIAQVCDSEESNTRGSATRENGAFDAALPDVERKPTALGIARSVLLWESSMRSSVPVLPAHALARAVGYWLSHNPFGRDLMAVDEPEVLGVVDLVVRGVRMVNLVVVQCELRPSLELV